MVRWRNRQTIWSIFLERPPSYSYERFKEALRAAIETLESGFEERFGYPVDPGSNRITDAAAEDWGVSEVRLPEELRSFYGSVGEIELPDVYIGYFVHSISAINESVERMLPTRIESDLLQLDVVTFGSDGGGGMFAIGLSAEDVYYLPSGAVHAGVYSGGLEEPRIIAPNFHTFLDELLSMTRLFAETGACRGF